MGNTKNTFMGLFGSQARRLLLLNFCLNPEKEFYTRELAKKTGINVGNIARELKKVESTGLIASRNIGHILLYKAKTNSPLFNYFKELVLKTIGVEELLRPIIAKEKSIYLAFIYGSYAKGEFETESDIDIMIIGDLNSTEYESVQSAIFDLEPQLNRELSVEFMTQKEFSEKIAGNNGYFNDIVENKKIFIKGDENELRLLIGKKS